MPRLPLVLMALLLALAPPAFAASGKDRATGGSGRAKAVAAAPANPAKATRPAAPSRRVAAAPARDRMAATSRSQARAPATARGRAASLPSARERRVASARPAAASRSAAATQASRKHAAASAYGRDPRLTWTSYGGRAYGDRFLSSAAAATPKSACGKRSRRGCGSGSAGWHRDLPPAANVQAAACPAGTMATLATGHSDVIRCMPL